jgi:threonyl-tRNA synthetase
MEPEKNIDMIRHSLSHVLAAAVKRLWPDAKFAIGPSIENGFYYDFDFIDKKIGEDDLSRIEDEMKSIIKENVKFERNELDIDEAIAKENAAGQIYKADLLEELKVSGERTVGYYRSGDFEDLCRGPHIQSSKEIKANAFKLTKLAGAYWRGNEKNKMLTRVYGVAFTDKNELDDHLRLMAEAEKRDHRRLAHELGLFMISEDVGKGLPLWLPNGAFIRKKLEDYMYQVEYEEDYKLVYTPILTHKKLYEISGHLSHYRDDMYNPIDIEGEEYFLKPMNCPHHHQIYNNSIVSYHDLPIKLAEFGICHRFERSGVLTGLIRARCFTQNDSHIYCRRSQLKTELLKVLALFKKVYDVFGIEDYWFRLSLPDFENNREKYGDIENSDMWAKAAHEARDAMEEFGARFVEGVGEATFYGPKIDVQIKNAHGKEDTIATAQIDFYSAGKFSLFFINEKGEKEQPVIIHRAIMGSFDRFFAFLTEHYAGAFPLWLSPIQVKIISVGESHIEHCRKLAAELKENNIRVEVDDASETVGNKIRKAVNEKVPYMLVIGDKEIGSENLMVRDRGSKETREIGKINFINEVKKKSDDKD